MTKKRGPNTEKERMCGMELFRNCAVRRGILLFSVIALLFLTGYDEVNPSNLPEAIIGVFFYLAGSLYTPTARDVTRTTGQTAVALPINEFLIPTSPNSNPTGITAGPDGNLWFTELTGNNTGRITTAGVITEFPVPAARERR